MKIKSTNLLYVLTAALMLFGAIPAFAAAAASPWENAVNNLMVSFTGPIAKGMSLVAIVVGGLVFGFGEGHGKQLMAGIIFGCGMALGAVNFVAWMFP